MGLMGLIYVGPVAFPHSFLPGRAGLGCGGEHSPDCPDTMRILQKHLHKGNSMSNQQANAFASQISTKLGGLVPSMKLFNHAYSGRVKLYGFGNIGPTIF